MPRCSSRFSINQYLINFENSSFIEIDFFPSIIGQGVKNFALSFKEFLRVLL